MVHWEILLLQELGFGLDLGECAITGETSNLVYVSPRSGRAVSQGAGKPYSDKLLQLPAFLLDEETVPDQAEIALGLGLTGYFLERHVFGPQGLHLPNARTHLAAIFTQARSGGQT